ncbi:MAG: hypothetical protein WA817_14145 [Candidatus Acidiferrum sp.]
MPDARLPLIYRMHAVRRMAERDIREEDVAHVPDPAQWQPGFEKRKP